MGLALSLGSTPTMDSESRAPFERLTKGFASNGLAVCGVGTYFGAVSKGNRKENISFPGSDSCVGQMYCQNPLTTTRHRGMSGEEFS